MTLTQILRDLPAFELVIFHTLILQKALLIDKEFMEVTRITILVHRLLALVTIRSEGAPVDLLLILEVFRMLHIFFFDV